MDTISEKVFVSACTIAAVIVRWNIASGSYSGMNKPPIYGDYEAQRHWQEITINIPPTDWYKNSTDNDLMYWGLDYPPLTAYHSWLCGQIAKMINPEWVALHESRGTESYEHKLFMRCTVLIADLVLFFPAVLLANKRSKNQPVNRQALIVTMFYPGLVLIDYGHFQYNNVSLGLFLLTVSFLYYNEHILAAVSFCLSLNYKQMELYHSVPIFCFLLGISFQQGLIQGVLNVIKLGLTVLVTFAICWIPFLGSIESVITVFSRLFPVGRGLYEDKVANFWCSISPVLKVKQLMDPSDVIKVCIAATVLSFLPSAVHLLRSPTVKGYCYSSVAVPLGFFLFSFQVHEKTILIPAVSACLIYAESPFLVTWFLHVSVFSMIPLLLKDGLLVPYLTTRYMFILITYIIYKEACKPDARLVKVMKMFSCNILHSSLLTKVLQFASVCSLVSTEILTMLLIFIAPPRAYPDIWPVLISTFCCAHFLLFLCLFTGLQFSCNSVAFAAKKKQS